MTKYNFNRLKIEKPAFYSIAESEEKNFRSAVANWMKRHRENGEFIIIKCEKVTEKLITGNQIFLGMRITREE